jgi:hypothetical protein
MRISLINGPFSVGKTSVAAMLVKRHPEMVPFDPEVIGAVLHRLIPKDRIRDDYQDLAFWRHLVIDAGHRMATDIASDVIVPMSLWRWEYFTEITDGWRRHGIDVIPFRLTCSLETLHARIQTRTDANGDYSWWFDHAERGIAAANDPRFGIEIPTEGRTVDTIVDDIALHLG